MQQCDSKFLSLLMLLGVTRSLVAAVRAWTRAYEQCACMPGFAAVNQYIAEMQMLAAVMILCSCDVAPSIERLHSGGVDELLLCSP